MIFHIDMDAFFASVEQLDRPELRGKCVIVGGQSKRGVVATASYEARKFGIHSAMPGFQARKMCPQAIFVPPRMDRYKELSRKIMLILQEFSPLVEPVSIDEAYMDATGCELRQGPPKAIGKAVKHRILSETGLTCSVGIAPNKFLAKIASDMEKPDGLTIIPVENVEPFINQLPIRKVSGVGETLIKKLDQMGIVFLGDIRRYSEKQLIEKLGGFGYRLKGLSHGIDRSVVRPKRPHKSMSSEFTLQEDTINSRELNRYLLQQAENVGRQLRKHDLKAKTVTLKIKHADFRLVSRRQTLATPTDTAESIYRVAAGLLRAYDLHQAVRLIGVAASSLVPAKNPEQMELFCDKEDHSVWKNVESAVDRIHEKFGAMSIQRASTREFQAGDKAATTSSSMRAGEKEPP
jgi:DNA polymerase IV